MVFPANLPIFCTKGTLVYVHKEAHASMFIAAVYSSKKKKPGKINKTG